MAHNPKHERKEQKRLILKFKRIFKHEKFETSPLQIEFQHFEQEVNNKLVDFIKQTDEMISKKLSSYHVDILNKVGEHGSKP